jgi:hypothetical protein
VFPGGLLKISLLSHLIFGICDLIFTRVVSLNACGDKHHHAGLASWIKKPAYDRNPSLVFHMTPA